MRYTGRISLTLFSLVVILGYLYLILDAHNPKTIATLLYAILIGSLSWFLGFQYDKVKYASYIDDLTQCYTRRFIEQEFPKLTRPKQTGQAGLEANRIVVYFFDVDHFKRINDQFGHQCGDEVLQHLSEILIELFFDRGYVVRWGGDEFAVFMLPDEFTHVDMIQKQIDEKLNRLGIEQAPVTVSIGQAIYPDEGLSLAEIVRIADERMYSQKTEERATKGKELE